MVDSVHSGLTASIPGGDVVAVTPYTPGHLYFDDPTWDQKIALRGRKTVYGQPYVVAHVNRPGSARSDDDKRYARLFGAAPELLEALFEARDALHQHYVDWDGEPEDAVPLQLARAKCDVAIAKATGPSTPAASTLDGYEAEGGVNPNSHAATQQGG